MKKNVGTIDSYFRIAFGLTCFGYGIINESKLAIAIGSMKVAEGITRFCPVLKLLDISTLDDEYTFKYTYEVDKPKTT